jgi:ParB family chromosome partitioning protein
MKLDFIPLGKLSVSKANMRHGKRPPDVSDILPTVRKRGVIVPVLVRPNCAPDAFEIVAGARRFRAAQLVAEERIAASEPLGDCEQLPCAILDNLARLDPDEVTQWETFTRLVKEGQKPEEIAATFGLPEPMIRRVLALGNLLPRIRDLYRHEKIDTVTVRHLTMASKGQQKAWLALYDDPQGYAPSGHQLKAWLFGGSAIKAEHALFDVEASGVVTVADLFGSDRYIADPDAFWTAQDAAIEARRADYIEAGWSDVVIVPPAEHFHSWEFEKAAKRKGGRVYADVRASGEVIFHEGYLSRKEARRIGNAGQTEIAKPARPEITSTLQTYIDLHRHAAVRAALTSKPQVALRLLVAHAIAGSHLFRVTPEPQAARNDAVQESVETCRGETVFDEKRRAVLGLLGFDPEAPTVTGGNGDQHALVAVFVRLLDVPEPALLEVIAIVMGEALAAGSAAVEAVGMELGVAMADWWQADDAFFELIRDKEVLAAIVGETAGAAVASANAGEKTKALKQIARDCLDGTNGRAKVERWVPRWMAFPPAAYTARGGVGTVRAAAMAEAARLPEVDPDPAAPAPAMPPVEEKLAA